MSALEAFTKKERKNVLSSIFGTGSDSEDSEEEEEVQDTGVPSSSLEAKNTSEDVAISMFTSKHCETFQVKYHERKALGIAHQLWPAASLLTDFLLSNPQHLHSNHSDDNTDLDMLELGAGLGLTSIYLAAYFNRIEPSSESCLIKSHRIVCTDIAEAIPGIVENIALNQALLMRNSTNDVSDVVAYGEELYWGQDEHIHRIMQQYFPYCQRHEASTRSPLVIAADVVYWENLFEPLSQVLTVLCKEYQCKIIIAHVKRWKKDSKFFALLKKKGLQVDTLAEDISMQEEENTGELRKHIQRIYRIYSMPK